MTLLSEYQKKRNFSKTAEPKGKTGKKNEQRFCIQQHHARAKHYDLRIELSGVLLSWAIPKGPSDDPKVKRLAVETEPHPMEYLTFEGTIPKGSYGAGKMIVWDIGHYELPDTKKNINKVLREQYDNGSIDMLFDGKKIKGLFKLVRTSTEKNQWLFFKKKDEYVKSLDFSERSVLNGREVTEVDEDDNPIAKAMEAGTEKPFPEEFQPMLAKRSDVTLSREDWLFEIKYDGYRCLVFKQGKDIRLMSRNGNLLNKDYPAVVEALEDIEPDGIFDGEIIAADDSGRAFGALLLGRTGPKGELLFAGKVGTGFNQKQSQEILKNLEKYKTDSPQAKTRDKITFWVKPHRRAQRKCSCTQGNV